MYIYNKMSSVKWYSISIVPDNMIDIIPGFEDVYIGRKMSSGFFKIVNGIITEYYDLERTDTGKYKQSNNVSGTFTNNNQFTLNTTTSLISRYSGRTYIDYSYTFILNYSTQINGISYGTINVEYVDTYSNGERIYDHVSYGYYGTPFSRYLIYGGEISGPLFPLVMPEISFSLVPPNKFVRTYVNGFLDISGSLDVNAGGMSIIGGDISMNKDLYLTNNSVLKLQNDTVGSYFQEIIKSKKI